MELRLAVLADAANVSIDGKLNVAGIFNRIRTNTLPAQHPLMIAAIQIEIGAADFGREAQAALRIVAPDGETSAPFAAKNKLPVGRAGEPTIWNIIFHLPNVRLAKTGTYEFRVIVDDNTFATIPLTLSLLETKASPPTPPDFPTSGQAV